METGKVRPVEPTLMIDDARLELLAETFIKHNVYATYGVTFERYLGYVAAGKRSYYVFCKGVVR